LAISSAVISERLNGTPTFFVNSVRHDGAPDYPSLLAALQRSRARGR
jgi:protein-disulfide isomerase